MSHFLATFKEVIPWVVLAIVLASIGWFAFKAGRKWRDGYKQAIENRNEYHALKSQAALQSRQSVQVNASPNIQIGSGLQSQLHYARRESLAEPNSGTLCPLCGRSDCWLDCGQAVDGRAHQFIPQHLDEPSTAAPATPVASPFGPAPWARATGERFAVDQQEELIEDDPEL